MKKVLFVANTIMVLFFVFRFTSLPSQIPLFYSKPWGEDQLADSWLIFILPLTMNFIFFINLYFNKKFFQENNFVKKIIDYLNLFIIVSITLIFIKIIFLTT
jgi:hypothetical protein